MSAKITDIKRKRPKAQRSAAINLARIEQGVRLILEGIGEDPSRDGLRETPKRVAEMYAELTAGMHEDPSEHIVPLSGDKHDEMVIINYIPLHSFFDNHLTPYVG